MIYRELRRLHPWIEYVGGVVLLITGFRLLMEGQWIGIAQLIAGVVLLLARVATAQRAGRAAGKDPL